MRLDPISFSTAQPLGSVDDIAEQSNLTRAQLLMWIGQKLHPQAPLYNMVVTFALSGPVDVAAFGRAFQSLIGASDALRTVVVEQDGIPFRRIVPDLPDALTYLDLSQEPDPAAAYADWLDQRASLLFKLEHRLIDAALICLGPHHYIWYLNQHHLITDGWSCGVIYREMAAHYALALEDRLDTAGPMPAYADYAAYERAQRSSAEHQAARHYWHAKCDRPLPPSQFYGRPVTGSSTRTRRISCPLGVERTSALKALAAHDEIAALSLDMTIFNVFATLLAVYLKRISGSDSHRIGVPFHGRPTAQFRKTAGLFIEIGPLAVEIPEGATFISAIQAVAEESIRSLRQARPGISSAALNRSYDVLLNFVNTAFPPFHGLPTHVDWVHTGAGDSNHGLRLQIHDFDGAGNYVLLFDFNEELFPPRLQQRAVQHFLQVVDALLANPAQRVDQFILMTAEEREQLLVAFNQTASAFPESSTVVDLFAAQVQRTPNATAVRHGSHILTYAELDQLSTRLAHTLAAQGATTEVLVGICLEHSPEMVAGVLAVLKTGAAYVPLDPAYPPARLDYMLSDAGAPIVLTQTSLLHLFTGSGARLLCVDNQADAPLPPAAPLPHAQPTTLAYVIYTSGSSGQPKGTLIEHRGLTNYLWWAQKHYLRGRTLDFALFSSLAFDLTVTSLFVPLISGGSVVVYRDEDGVRGMSVLKVVEEGIVDVVKLTPSHLALLKHAELAQSRVKVLIVGGEDFKTDLARTIFEHSHGRVEIYNEYGPTETVVGAMIHRYDPIADTGLSVPIGHPIDNMQVYILDAQRNPVPTGVIGEMYIGGPGAARGYHNRPLLTEERFVWTRNPAHVSAIAAGDNLAPPAQRLYRTGDLARWNLAGDMEFLGRRDEQVKVGGARIELGEVEAALATHPAVEACFVDVVRHLRNANDATVQHCIRCGLPSNYPGAGFDLEGLCSYCRAYAEARAATQAYFRTPDELRSRLERARAKATGSYDCIMLYSGGKDSTYALCQLADMGLRILAFTLDNGYLSEQAKTNISRVVATLGVDHSFGSTPAMNLIFRDSLQRFSNVCNGCFKTIYTLATNLARSQGVYCIVTGLSRGQFFETRLTPDLFRYGGIDVERIDQEVLEARKAYHRADDAIAHHLDTSCFRDDTVFEEVDYLDFYRYWDVNLEEMYAYLAARVPWSRPADTGRSTNCLINDAGIMVHRRERGFHNYALPYSWDVRMGHKTRQEALDELDDKIDEQRISAILREIGYVPQGAELGDNEVRLAAYFVAAQALPASVLRTYLAEKLPDYMVPTHFVRLDSIPLTANGKVDRAALPDPTGGRPALATTYTPPATPLEHELARLWRDVLSIPQIGVHDNFFELGGTSLPAIQVVAQISRRFNIDLSLRDLFTHPTIAGIADRVEALIVAQLAAMDDAEAARLLALMEPS
jgi:amino acid adenylation domain-containing protein